METDPSALQSLVHVLSDESELDDALDDDVSMSTLTSPAGS
jgi:hypothetical protein